MNLDDFENELKIGFLDEADQLLGDVEQCFLSLETSSSDPENLNKIFRLAHNLKGSSKAVGFVEMGDFTHEFETFILKIKNSEIAIDGKCVSLLLRCNDFLRNMVSGLKSDLEAKFDGSSLLAEMTGYSSEAVIEAPAESTAPEEEVAESADETEFEAEPEAETAPEILMQAAIPKEETPLPPPPPKVERSRAPAAPADMPPEAPKAGGPVVEETLRVSVSKVESLLNAVGEMVILQSVLREQISAMNSPIIRKTVLQMGKLSKEIQDVSMGLRMVPVKPTFQKMQRIVRDTAKALEKDVSLILVGEETEIDKTVLEKINDPLVHLIRNSVDHGIEAGSVRKSKGKEERGYVTLTASHRSGKLMIEVRDDGAGLDPARLQKKALEKGLIKPDLVLSDKEAYQLIFLPGFSTKEQVTDVSGRGVGMDVVRTNIQDLSGEIEIDSKLGEGTVFRIYLPLTLAIIDGMVVTQENHRFVIPLTHVHETLQPTAAQIQTNSSLGQVLLLRGENLPMVRLGDYFGIGASMDVTKMIAMVIRSGPQPFAILVDDIVGQFQVVVKQLGPELQHYKGVSGSTILGDGKPALIIEPLDLRHRKLSVAKATTAKPDVGLP